MAKNELSGLARHILKDDINGIPADMIQIITKSANYIKLTYDDFIIEELQTNKYNSATISTAVSANIIKYFGEYGKFLFDKIKVIGYINIKDNFAKCTLDFKYTHPSGGSNGYTFAILLFENKKNKWVINKIKKY